MNTQEFKILMQTVAEGWNEGNAQKAVDCFTENATYIEPPDKQLFQGKEQLFIYFGGGSERKKQMKMIWHNLFFDEEKQIGAGEYTFEMSDKNHGVVVVELHKGKIKLWREYQWSGNLDRNDFLSTENKNFQFIIKDLLH